MNEQAGRNDPCPCGSGKKYKKCCGPKDEEARSRPDLSMPAEMLTNTPLDACLQLMPALTAYSMALMNSGPEGRELEKACMGFEKRFHPGSPDGAPDSFFFYWQIFDYHFGKTRETVCQRFMKIPELQKLNQIGNECIKMMSGSYSAWYRVISLTDMTITFRELYTDRILKSARINEPFERGATPGDLWYTRFFLVQGVYYIASAPYILPSEAEKDFLETIGRQVKEYEKLSSGEVWAQKNNIFASYCKASAYGWLVYLHPEKSSVIPKILVNTDKELLQVTKVYFLIDVITGLSEKLDKQKTFSYDKRNSIWIWQGKNRKNKVLFPNITLGTLKMEGNRLVGETNSLERALRLKQKLENEFKGYLKYEKMESFSQDSLPKPSAEELERMHRENEELNSRPEVQEALRQKLEEHYLTDWVNHRVPALNNLSPQQAAKTDKGKKMLEELISSFEKMQESRPIKVDFNKLRKKLGM